MTIQLLRGATSSLNQGWIVGSEKGYKVGDLREKDKNVGNQIF